MNSVPDSREAQLRPLVERARALHAEHSRTRGVCRECLATAFEEGLLELNRGMSAGDAFEAAWEWLKERQQQ